MYRLIWVAVPAILASSWQPRPSRADFIYGSWDGGGTVFVSEYQLGQFVGSYSYGYAGTMTLEYDSFGSLLMAFGGYSIAGEPFASFGPTSASGTVLGPGGHGPPSVGNFALSYQSILPDGMIDPDGSFASADLTTNTLSGLDSGDEIFLDFTGSGFSAPEPSSIVTATIAVLAIGAYSWSRGARRPDRGALRVAS